jgi:hypothetical protein
MGADTSTGLWLVVISLGVYHGLNPAMGWPLAVANGLTARRGSAVFATALPLGTGHLLAMAVVLLPFVWLARFAEWNQALRAGAGALVLAFGLYKLVDRRHPRFLARVRPTQLAWWSFLMASAHGAALMLLPVTLALCRAPLPSLGWADAGFAAAPAHEALLPLLASGVTTALTVAVVHTFAMIGSGVAIAWAFYRYLGLKFLRQSWLNLDTLWALSLIVTGGAGFAMAIG